MIFPSMDKLENWGSKFALVVLAAKRAKQIKSGSPTLIDTETRNPLTAALEEIAAEKVTHTVPDNDLIIVSHEEPEIAQLLALTAEEMGAEELASAAVHTGDEEEDILIEEEYEDEEEELEEPELILVAEEDDEYYTEPATTSSEAEVELAGFQVEGDIVAPGAEDASKDDDVDVDVDVDEDTFDEEKSEE